jgi:hypothetical protein
MHDWIGNMSMCSWFDFGLSLVWQVAAPRVGFSAWVMGWDEGLADVSTPKLMVSPLSYSSGLNNR